MESNVETSTEEYVNDKNNIDKTIEFLKNNLLNFLLVCIYGVFLFKEMVKIEESGKTVLEIIADTFISFFMGMATNIIMGQKGQSAAMSCDWFINCQKSYQKEIDLADTRIDELDDFCEEETNGKLARTQRDILRMERIKYEDFITKEKTEVCTTKEKEKCWDKAQHVKVQIITADYLLSEVKKKRRIDKADETLPEHNRKKTMSGASTKLLMALIFGYFTVSLAQKVNLLWSVIQVCIWLLWGIMSYLQEYMYIRQVYMQKIFRKIAYLKKFNKKGEIKNG